MEIVRAGRLKESIEIWRYTTTRDDYGQETKTYTLLSTVRAEAKDLSESEKETGGKYEGRELVEFYLRYTDINKSDRIVWNNQNFEIIEVINKFNRNVDLTIKAITSE